MNARKMTQHKHNATGSSRSKRGSRTRRLGSAALSLIVTVSMVLSLWPVEGVREAQAQVMAAMAAQEVVAEQSASAPPGDAAQDSGASQEGGAAQNDGTGHANDANSVGATNKTEDSEHKAEGSEHKAEDSDHKTEDSDHKTEDAGQKSGEQAPAPRVLERTITVGEEPEEGEPDTRRTYSVRLTYSADANVPDNAELSVSEIEVKDEHKNALRDQLGLEEGDRVVAENYLDISLTSGGQAVQPAAPVEVVLETREMDPACSDAVEAVVLGEQDHAVEVQNLTGKRDDDEGEDEQPAATKLKLTTSRLGKFAFAAVVRPFDTWGHDGQTVSLLGPRAKSVEVGETLHEDERIDDKDLLRTVSFQTDPAHAWHPALWVESHFDEAYDAANGAVACYRVEEGHLADEVFGAAGTDGPVEVDSGGEYAFVLEGAPEGEQTQDEQKAEDMQDAEANKEQNEAGKDAGQGEDAQPTEDEPEPDSAQSGAAKIDEAEAVSEVFSLERTYTASDGKTYRISVGCDDKAAVPASAELVVSEIAHGSLEYLSYVAQAADVLAARPDAVAFAKALDVTLVDSISGEEIQPREDVKVLIELLDADLSENGRVGVVHFGETTEAMDATVKGDAVTFETDGFSVYVVLQTVKETILTASDGSNYKITVTYDTESGIPAEAELAVTELAQDDPQYATYVEGAADTLGKETRHLAYAHAFDISLVDPETGEHYQPTESVRVSIELLTEDVEKGDSLKVVHFGKEPEVLESSVRGKGVEFETGGFSIIVVAKEDLLMHFEFYSQDDDGKYYKSSEQLLCSGETLVKPADPTSGGAVFAGWSKKENPDLEDVLPEESEDPTKDTEATEFSVKDLEEVLAKEFSSETIQGNTYEEKQQWLENHPIKYYAVFQRGKVAVTFYNQSGQVFRRTLVDKQGSLSDINSNSKYDYTEYVIQNKEGTFLSFVGWVDNPQGTGTPVDGSTTYSKDTDLYPKLTEGHYLHFDSNREDASTIESLNVPVGSYDNASDSASAVLSQLNNRPTTNPVVPTAEGFVFTGWYIRASDENDFDAGDAKTKPVFEPTDNELLKVNDDEFKKLLNPSHNLPNSPTLYAHWVKAPDDPDPGTITVPTTAPYTIQIWAQSAEEETRYDFVKSVDATGTIGADASTTVNGTNYAQNGTDSGQYDLGKPGFNTPGRFSQNTVQADGSTVVNIYYDRKQVTVRFMLCDGYEEETGTDGTQYGLVDGRYVELTKGEDVQDVLPKTDSWEPDVYSYSYEVYEAVTDALSSGEVFYVQADGTYSSNQVEGSTAYKKTGEVRRYTGQRYTKENNAFSASSSDGSSLYGVDDNGNFVTLTASHWTYTVGEETLNYTGTRYKTKTTPDWYEWKTLTGLYGQTFAQKDPSWSEALEFDWYTAIDNSGAVTGNPVQGLDHFERDATYYGTKLAATNTKTVTFYKQKSDNPDEYEVSSHFTTSNGPFTINNVYPGFEISEYKKDDEAVWTPWAETTGEISFSSTLEVRYIRKQYDLAFDQCYQDDQNQGVKTFVSVSYGSKPSGIAGYDKPPTPEREGWRFDGWYRDPALRRRITSTEYVAFTMPDEAVTFYAKWTAVKYLVRLVPNGGELPENQSPLLYVSGGNTVTLPQSITREYVNVGAGKGEYNYDEFYGRYELATEKTDETCYSSKSGAYQFECWQKGELAPRENDKKEIIEYSSGKYAYAYGHYEKVDEGAGSYTLTDDGYQFVGEGRGDYAFDYAPLKKSGSDYETQAFNPKTESVTDFTVLVAEWRAEDTFRVKYNVEDPALNLPDSAYNGVTAPVDETEYVDGGGARVLPAVTAPDGYTLDYWSNKNDTTHYRSNDLVTVSSSNAELGSDGLMWVTLTAHYRPYDTTERDIAEFKFMKPKLSDPAGDEYELYDVQRISKGETLMLPATPEAPEGYVFRGWFYDKKGNYPFRDFSPTNPTHTILYARFEKSVSVDFYLTEAVGSQYAATQKVLATRTYPVDGVMDTLGVNHPVDSDHYVDKWIAGKTNWENYKTNPQSVDSKYIFGYKSTSSNNVPAEQENRKLYAVLKERNYVLFDTQGGSYVGNQELPENGIPEKPADPTKDGFLFAGWYTGPETDSNATEYTFDKSLADAGATPNGNTTTLYAHWNVNTSARGTLHVIFWAQTADRPENAVEAAEDKEHYQMLYSVDLTNCVPYGRQERDGAYLKDQLSDFLDKDGKYDLIKTVRKGWNEQQGAATAFVTDALGYKGNNADVIQNYKPENYIDQLNRYYVFNAEKSDGSVVVDGSDNTVLNIRFDLKTFKMEFEPKFDNNNWCEIHYKGKTYEQNPSTKYGFDIWLNRSIPEKLWPSICTDENTPPSDTAYFNWNNSGNSFHSWQINQYQLSGTSVKQEYKKANYRTPMNLSDKLLIDTAIEKTNDHKTLVFKPDKFTGNGWFTKTGVVHYLLRDGRTTAFTERMDLRTKVFMPDHTTKSSMYPHFTTSRCLIHVSGNQTETFHATTENENQNPWDKYAYYDIQPVGIPGYKVIDNETGHEGDLLNSEGTQDDGNEDGKNTLFLCNLIKDRIGRAQVLFNTNNYTYKHYFEQNPLQFDSREDVYNLYFYYKPLSYELTLCIDSSTPVGEPESVFCGEKLHDGGYLPVTVTPPAEYRVGYRFAGWSTTPFQNSAKAAIKNDFTMPAYNLTLYAIWEPVTCNVTTWGVDNSGVWFEAGNEGQEIDASGQQVENGKTSYSYKGKYGQRLRELNIPNPQKSESLFKYWKNKDNDRPVTGMYTLTGDLTIKPEWDSLEIRKVWYYKDKAAMDSDVALGSPYQDSNDYIEGAKAVIKDGKGLTVSRTNVDGNPYEASFTCWEDTDGNRYYPNDSYTMKGVDLKLYACYSEYRETKLTYHGENADFINENETPYTETGEDNTIVVYFRDWLRPDFNSDAGDMIPNHQYPKQYTIGKDQNGNEFKVKLRDDAKQLALAGWSNKKNSPTVIARNGDRVYVNKIDEENLNHLYPVWGICKVVDNADGLKPNEKHEHVFESIGAAVGFIQNEGKIDGTQYGNLKGKTGTIEMLIDNYTMWNDKPQVTIPEGTNVTLTTAHTQKDRNTYELLLFEGNEDTGDRAIIERGEGITGSMFKVESGGSFTTQNIILDGGAVLYPDTKWNSSDWGCTGAKIQGSGGIINSNGSVVVGAKSILQNSAVTGTGNNGGAVYVSATGSFDIQGEITRCISINGHGGGAYVASANDLLIDGIDSNQKARVSYCKAAAGKQNNAGSNGGGIYIGDGAKTTVKNIRFDHCVACGGGNHDGGAGLYVTSFECTVNNCDFEDCESPYKNAAGLFHYNEGAKAVTTVEDSTFKRCKAVSNNGANGNSGGAMEADAQTVTIRNTTFEDCESRVNGGAINVWNNAAKATVEVDNCSFIRCTARTNNGGGVRNYGKKTTITDCIFDTCIAKQGGGVCSDTGNGSLDIYGEKTSFENCSANTSGGGIYLAGGANSTLNFSDGTINDCTAPNGGGVYLGNGTFNFISGIISGSKSTTQHGGGVYQNGGTFNLNGGTISGCEAAKHGGGVYQNGGTFNLNVGTIEDCNAYSDGGGVCLNADKAAFNLQGGAIDGCSSLASGGGVYLGGGTFKLTNGQISTCHAKAGGGVYINGSSMATISKNGVAIQDCQAVPVRVDAARVFTFDDAHTSDNKGGGLYQNGGKLTITKASISGCSAYDGGGIYLNGNETDLSIGEATKSNGGVITGCEVSNNGGGIYLNNGTLNTYGGTSIKQNTAANGGGIYQGGGTMTIGTLNGTGGSIQGNVATSTSANGGFGGGIYLGGGTFTLNSGSIGVQNDVDEPENGAVGGNRARKGGGLYVGNGSSKDAPTTASIAGGIIGGNHATEAAGGGGIAIGGEFVRLNFSGNIQVWGNTMEPSEAHPLQKRCDVCLSEDSDYIIWTTDDGLDEDSHIGVYVTDKVVESGANAGKQLHWDLHGRTNMRFGTHPNSGSGAENLNRFINNRSGDAYDHYEYYYGVSHPGDDDGIYWASYICEITDEQGHLLFTNNKATAPALYQYLGKYGAFDALEKHATFYTKDKKEYSGTDYYVRMLVLDYDLQWAETVPVPNNGNIWLMMADDTDSNLPAEVKENYSKYDGCAMIRRGNCIANPMFTTEAESNFTIQRAIIDGGAVFDEESGECTNGQTSIDGALIKAGGGNLTLGNNATLQNSVIQKSSNDHYGAAVWYSGPGTFNMSDGSKIERCDVVNGGGGAVLYVNTGNANDEVSFEAPSQADQVSDCTATNGLVYVKQGTLTLSGTFRGATDPDDSAKVANVTDCGVTNGGLAYVDGGTLNVNGAIDRFTAQYGGAVYSNGGTVNLQNEIVNCSAANDGGAVYIGDAGSLVMSEDNSSIKNCTAEKGGGIYANGGDASAYISKGELSGNKATSYGGGALRLEGSSSATITGTARIKDNTAEGSSTDKFGGAVNIKNGSLTVSGGRFENNKAISSAKGAYGGAIHASGVGTDYGELTITGGVFVGNEANGTGVNANGGAICLRGPSMDVNISGGEFIENKATTNIKDAFGGAIAAIDGGNFTLTGATFNKNTATTGAPTRKNDGAAIYLSAASDDYDASVLNLSGAPTFGEDENANTITPKTNLSEKKNGNDNAYTDNKARQDIFIAETKANPQSIVVTGDLVKENDEYLGDGSIWVWAESDSHYRQLMPFAVMDEDVKFANKDEDGKLPEGTLDAAHLKAFRNARDNDTTGNATEDYLYGVIAADSANSDGSQYVYWTGIAGSRKVILRKVDSSYAPMKDKEFKIFQGSSTSPLAEEQSGASGLFYIGTLPYGWYVLEETEPHKYFYIVVASSGVYGTVNDSGENTVGGYDTRQEAETAAKERYASI